MNNFIPDSSITAAEYSVSIIIIAQNIYTKLLTKISPSMPQPQQKTQPNMWDRISSICNDYVKGGCDYFSTFFYISLHLDLHLLSHREETINQKPETRWVLAVKRLKMKKTIHAYPLCYWASAQWCTLLCWMLPLSSTCLRSLPRRQQQQQQKPHLVCQLLRLLLNFQFSTKSYPKGLIACCLFLQVTLFSLAQHA